MASVPSVVKIKKGQVTYTSKVDRTKYLLTELTRAALRDVGKYLRHLQLNEARKLKGLKRGKRPLKAFQFWVRKKEGDLVVGIKHDTWYGVQQELGTSKQPKRSILKDTTYNNIGTIREIEAQYLSTIEDELKAIALVDDEEYKSNEEGEDQA